MNSEIALAVLERDNGWLLQLRDDFESVLYPGHWGLFGGHINPGEKPSQAIHRELIEEINWSPTAPLEYWFSNSSGQSVVHVFRGPLTVPVQRLKLLEGQDLKLTSLNELHKGKIWSETLAQARPIAPGLNIVISRLLNN
ncbi:NUDIX hydrolase [Synechococcus sp. M16CYN]|uniref:NUDIX hydrolase n=1 Tax=Synechococcus sp. M16CYN TaxID=3103139 RepID=UPI00324B600E